MRLREAADGRGCPRHRIAGGERSGRRELPLGGHGAPHVLEGDAVQDLGPYVGPAGGAGEGRELQAGREALDRLGHPVRRNEGRSARQRAAGIEQRLGVDRERGVRLQAHGASPGRDGVGVAAGPVVGEAQVEHGERAVWMRRDEPLHLVEAAVRPGRERRADARLERGVAGEHGGRRGAPALGVERGRAGQRAGLRVVTDAEVEHQRRCSRLRLADGPWGGRALAAGLEEGDAHRGPGGRNGCERDDRDDPGPRAHLRARVPAPDSEGSCDAIFVKVMPSYRELLRQVKTEVEEVDAAQARELLESGEPPVLVDVRERDEWSEGHIPGAVHVPRGHLESRIEQAAPDRSQPVVLYCAGGSRSAFAAKTLEELGYENVSSLAGGFTDWKRNGYPTQLPRSLDAAKRQRYSRHLLIPEVGEQGQLRLLDSRVLLIGAGGLGSPAALYLAAAGVGTLGIVDDDAVDATNLQRQIVHSTERLGDSKAESAKRTIEALNPDVAVKTFQERLTSENVDRILGEGWDVIVDGADNFPTRYLLNDASIWHDIPVVHGSIFRFEGQVTVFKPGEGPCYRCLFPQPPPPELAPSCAEGGVLGVLPGIIGSIQASEALKLAMGIGEPLVGRLLLFDALAASFTEVAIRRDPACPVCGDNPTITEYVDYVEFCQGPRAGSAVGVAAGARPQNLGAHA